MEIPEGLKFTKDHEWVRVDGATATVGITEFAQSELGEIVFVDLPAAGKKVKPKDTLCVVESTKAASDVYCPVGGTVREVNAALSDSPSLINSSPYKEGWMVKIEGFSAADAGALLGPAEYRKLVGERA